MASPAAAERVIVVSPIAEGPSMVALAAELALALDRALPGSAFERVGEQAATASELATALGCLDPDTPCMQQAARAAGASLALVAQLTRAGAIIGATLERVPASPRKASFVVRRRIDLGRARLDDRLLATLARLLASDLLAESAARPPAVVAAAAGDVEIDGRRAYLDGHLDVAPGRHTVLLPGGDAFELDLLPGELAVLEPPAAAVTDEAPGRGRRIAAWMSAGVASASLLGAGIMGARLAGTQNDYDRTDSGTELREFSGRGKGEALSANILLGVGVAALLTSAVLFWE
ncbi:MAG: hypothetical protein R3F60_13830 [bacterium]